MPRQNKLISGGQAVRQVMKTLGVSREQAEALLRRAVKNGQLCPVDHDGEPMSADEMSFEDIH